MSAKGKDKVDDTASIINNNRGEGALTPVTTITVVKLKKDTLIKVRELAVFIEDRMKFIVYKISVGLAVWADNKREKPNRTIKTVSE
jgi:hypothetical protein